MSMASEICTVWPLAITGNTETTAAAAVTTGTRAEAPQAFTASANGADDVANRSGPNTASRLTATAA